MNDRVESLLSIVRTLEQAARAGAVSPEMQAAIDFYRAKLEKLRHFSEIPTIKLTMKTTYDLRHGRYRRA